MAPSALLTLQLNYVDCRVTFLLLHHSGNLGEKDTTKRRAFYYISDSLISLLLANSVTVPWLSNNMSADYEEVHVPVKKAKPKQTKVVMFWSSEVACSCCSPSLWLCSGVFHQQISVIFEQLYHLDSDKWTDHRSHAVTWFTTHSDSLFEVLLIKHCFCIFTACLYSGAGKKNLGYIFIVLGSYQNWLV